MEFFSSHNLHPLCHNENCSICSHLPGPVILDEVYIDKHYWFSSTKREKDLGNIIKFFKDTCRDAILDIRTAFYSPTDSFKWLLNYTVLHCEHNNSWDFTYAVHVLSQHYPDNDISFELYNMAQCYNVTNLYVDFMLANRLMHFMPQYV